MKWKHILVYSLIIIWFIVRIVWLSIKNDTLGGLWWIWWFAWLVMYMLWVFKMPWRDWSEEKKKEVQKRQEEASAVQSRNNVIIFFVMVIFFLLSLLWIDINAVRDKSKTTLLVIIIAILALAGLFLVIRLLKKVIWRTRESVVNIIADAIKKSKK